jgi:hypothetical protein
MALILAECSTSPPEQNRFLAFSAVIYPADAFCGPGSVPARAHHGEFKVVPASLADRTPDGSIRFAP